MTTGRGYTWWHMYRSYDEWKADSTLYAPTCQVIDVDGEQEFRGPLCYQCNSPHHVSYRRTPTMNGYCCEPCWEELSPEQTGV